ncbi:excalibur calcium-binding domain-containing protein [Fictibacillus aquaticus]|uniref:Excalibur calcium-binding domain-containing protein n=1 Tax=Fictibacillus aquaticus TaxID=2021314 RepID=A0A235F5S1_9BACL|nr:excalibur calcium-binding domain-containing protein [Fictibacillus aquaticus]OYD56610.1 hypothetical protein CGZ90_16495 [Fictibacillus aquaticus]
MQNWIGNKPTLSQQAASRKYDKVLQHALYSLIPDGESVIKIIEAECDKKSGREIKGVLALTNAQLHFFSKQENFSIPYEKINDIDIRPDGKDKTEWQLTLRVSRSTRNFDDIKKDDDSQEFFDILEKKIISPNQQILTTVTHNFDYFLHAEKLEELKKNNVQITSFLMKRDDLGFSKNGERLLKEKHPDYKLIIEATYKDKKEKKGNFIVVDKFVWLYEYNDKERRAKKIVAWPFAFFSEAVADHYAIKTEILTNEGALVLKSSGKKFVEELSAQGIVFSVKMRKWYNKILGYRSRKWWKMTISSLTYASIFFIALIILLSPDEDSAKSEKKEIQTVATTTATNDDADKKENEAAARAAEEKRKQEAAARAAEEKRKEEAAARAAEEKRKQEAAARAAEEQRKQEAAARAAEEQRKQEAAARAAEDKRKQEAAAANVYFKNCDAARAAGAAPVHQGEPGYGKHLDRDGDGTGCDS